MNKNILILFSFFILTVGLAHSATNSKRILLQDFEKEGSKINQINDIEIYKGPRSKMSFEIVTNLVHGGKSALLVNAEDVNDPVAVVFHLNYMAVQFSDWGKIKYFHCWILGTGTQEVFDIFLEDWQGEEFGSLLVNNWKGWKEIFIPISDFHSRLDWQPPYSKVNRKIDFPLVKMLFPCFFYARTVLVFDDIEFVLE